MEVTILFIVAVVLLVTAFIYTSYVRSYRTRMISTYTFPESISKKVSETYPHLSDQQINQVMEGLRDYFHIINMAPKNKMVAMPSQVVDVAWHEFILFTEEYARFCRKALGRFIHHTPAEAMKSPTKAQEGIKRAWRLACIRAQINPAKPTKLPLLFAIDSRLEIENGFEYQLNCKKPDLGNKGQCATHIGCSTGCGGNSSSSGADGCSGGGCSGGCGGS